MQIAFKSRSYIQIKLPHLSYYTIYMLPSGTMTTFHHNQQFSHDQPSFNPKFDYSSTVSDICSAHIHVGHISEATYQFHEISLKYLLNNETITDSLLYTVIILSERNQLPLPVSLFTALTNNSEGQQSSQSHSLNTGTFPNCSFGLAVPSHSLCPVLIIFSQSETQDCYKHRLLQYSF